MVSANYHTPLVTIIATDVIMHAELEVVLIDIYRRQINFMDNIMTIVCGLDVMNN